MAKRHRHTSRSGPITYIAFAVVVYILFSGALALATSGSACGDLNAYKEWRLFPPGWECPTISSGP